MDKLRSIIFVMSIDRAGGSSQEGGSKRRRAAWRLPGLCAGTGNAGGWPGSRTGYSERAFIKSAKMEAKEIKK